MPVRGIRGAITVERDTPQDILAATRELLAAMVQANQLEPDDIASVLFTTTPDLSGDYPARAARELGWSAVPLLGATEMHVPGALARCIRVLLHVNTTTHPSRIKHIYLREARALRPDR
ncbi:MAG: chorismate mutase [Gemmatimonadetes bacterium]|nr:chorismate mutase [Gemmatimonadota bacterium]MBI2614219.1 chorismate mutase [Gemmatimonadota bacterium]